MTNFEWVMVALTSLSVLLIPILVLMFRGAIHWTRTDDRLTDLVEDVESLIRKSDKMQSEILNQMTYDREATNKRLRFIEEYWMTRKDIPHGS